MDPPTGRGALALAALLFPLVAGALAPDKPFHQYARDTWSVEQGLPQISVHALAQGKDGYIWAGTQRGLARFDGVGFRVYQPADTPDLPSRWIHSLLRDRRDEIWIGTDQGAARFDGARFHAVALLGADGSAAPVAAQVWHWAESAKFGIVAATSSGLFRQNGADTLESWDVAGKGQILAITASPDAIWAGPTGEVVRIPNDGGAPTHYAMPGDAHNVYVNALLEHDGVLWIGSRAGLYRLVDGQVQRVELAANVGNAGITALFVDRDDNLWVGTDTALLRLRDGALREAVSETEIPALSYVDALIEDHEGNLWIGSYQGGVSRVWNGWIDRYSRPEGLDDIVAWVIAEWTAGRVLVGVRSGLRVLDHGRYARLPEFALIDGRSVESILVDGDDLWIGTDQGLFRDRAGRTEKMFQDALRGMRVRSMRRLRDHRIALATSQGFYTIEDGALSKPIVLDSGTKPFLRTVAEDTAGRVYVGGPLGAFEIRDGRMAPLGIVDRGRALATSVITPLPDGDLLLGGNSDSLWWRDKGAWRELPPSAGIPLNNNSSIVLDRFGWVWVGGVLGLSKFPVADLEALASGRIGRIHADMVLSISGQVPGAQKASCCSSSGGLSAVLIGDDLWLPTPDGAIRMPVNGITQNMVVPQVQIERVRWAGDWHDVVDGAPLALPSGARDLDFDFTTLSFRDPKSVGLKYQLVGYDRDWRVLDSALHRRATYTNLEPGAYTFRVVGANDAGMWNERPAELALSIAPRFVETRTFKLLVALALAAIVYAALRLRTAALRRDRDRLEALVRKRTTALEQANQALHEASESDPLTGLHNRRFFLSHLASDLTELRHRMAADAACGVYAFVMADIDRFKSINDQHGHDAGDAVLCHFARLLRGTVAEGDHVIRWGGEEFVLVLRGIDRDALGSRVESLRRAVAESATDLGNDTTLRVTASFGAVVYPLLPFAPDALSWQQHIELADMALYHAKRAGRNTWAIYRASREADTLVTEQLAAGPIADLVTAGVLELKLREPAPRPVAVAAG